MVQAILAGRKTQTRRVVKDDLLIDSVGNLCGGTINYGQNLDGTPNFKNYAKCKCPYGQPGDVLWVRETSFYDVDNEEHRYAADMCKSDIEFFKGFWKPSIHMPKAAARIWLEITNVRVERLQEISEEDAIGEGVEIIHTAEPTVHVYKKYNIKEYLGTTNPVVSFTTLWHSINGPESWNSNPWVWVVEFKQINKPKENG